MYVGEFIVCSFYFSAAAFKAGKFLNVLSLKLTLSKSGYFETVRIFITMFYVV